MVSLSLSHLLPCAELEIRCSNLVACNIFHLFADLLQLSGGIARRYEDQPQMFRILIYFMSGNLLWSPLRSFVFLWFVSVWISLSLCPCCCIFNAKLRDWFRICIPWDSPPFIYDFPHQPETRRRYASCGCTMTATVCSPSGLVVKLPLLPLGKSQVKTFPFCHCLFRSLRLPWSETRHFNYVSLAINHTQSWKSSSPHPPGSWKLKWKNILHLPLWVMLSDLLIDHWSEVSDI